MAGPYAATGKLTLLRVHERGSGWGPANDFLDCEAVVRLSSEPNKAFGLQLRPGLDLPANQAMLEVLRLSFKNQWNCTVEYVIDPGKANGTIVRTYVQK